MGLRFLFLFCFVLFFCFFITVVTVFCYESMFEQRFSVPPVSVPPLPHEQIKQIAANLLWTNTIYTNTLIHEPSCTSIFVALITWAKWAFVNPYWASGAEDFPLWAATSVWIEHRELLQCHLVPNRFQCRGHTVNFKWDSSVSKMHEINTQI